MSKGKGKRRRLRNQQLAVQAKRNFRSFMGHGSVVHDGSEISEGHGKQKDGLSKNLRFIMQFCNKNSTTQEEEKEKKKDQDGVDGRSKRMASAVPSDSQPMKKDMDNKTTTSSSTSSKKLHGQVQGQDEVTKSGDDDVKVQQKHQRKGTKAKNNKEEHEYTFKKQAGNPRNGKLVLEQIKKKKKKKGYLDIRREKKIAKRQRKMQPDEDEDLRYDHRRFFDEVAYEPPKLAIEKSKLFYNNKGRGK